MHCKKIEKYFNYIDNNKSILFLIATMDFKIVYTNIISDILGIKYTKFLKENDKSGEENTNSDWMLVKYMKNNNINNFDKLVIPIIMSGFKECTKYLFFEEKIKMNDFYFQALANHVYDYSQFDLNKLFEDFQFDKEHLKISIDARNTKIIDFLICKRKIEMDNISSTNYIIKIEDKKENYEKIFNNFVFNHEHLKIAIENKNSNFINYLIYDKNIELNQNLGELLINNFIIINKNTGNKNKIFDLIISFLNKNNITFNLDFINNIINETQDINLILKFINEKKFIINNELIELFLKNKLFWKDNKIDEFLFVIIDNIKDNLNDNLISLSIESQNFKFLKKIIETKRIEINDECINQLIGRQEIKIKDENIIEYLELIEIKYNFKYNSTHLEYALQKQRIGVIKYFLAKKNVLINETCILLYFENYYYFNNNSYNVFKYKLQYNEMFKTFINNNTKIKYNQVILNAACKSLFLDGVNEILNSNDIEPNFEICINLILDRCYKSIKFRYDDNINKILLSLKKKGFYLAENNIIEFINKGMQIDEELYENFIPSAKFYESCKFPEMCNNACKDIYYLRKLCLEQTNSKLLLKIKNHIIQYKIIPDYYCFLNSLNCNKKWNLLLQYIQIGNNNDSSIENSIESPKKLKKDKDIKNSKKSESNITKKNKKLNNNVHEENEDIECEKKEIMENCIKTIKKLKKITKSKNKNSDESKERSVFE